MRPYIVTANDRDNWQKHKVFYVELPDDRIPTAQIAIDQTEPGWNVFWVQLDKIPDTMRRERGNS